jgi:hypothetical protein
MSILRADAGAEPAPPLSERRPLPSSVIAWLILAFAAVLPPRGVGIPICPSKLVTGVPCPGCGLTRSVTCLAHAELARSWHYHPFGCVVFALAIWFALVPLAAPRLHRRAKASRPARAAGLLLLIAFILYGVVRGVLWMGGEHFPAGGS